MAATTARRRTPRRRGIGVSSLVGLLVLSVVLAGCQLAFDAPAATARIEKVEETVTSDGWRYELFRNLAYPCSVSGYQTFVIGTRVGDVDTTVRPLWVRLRGGGSGWFFADGTPFENGVNMTEEVMGGLRGRLREAGLSDRIFDHPAGFRGLSVSMCNRDVYGGANNPDPYNFDTAGKQRTTNGLLATKAAIQFTRARHATSKFFLHGGSAGAVGTVHVAYSLQAQGIPAAGIVADGGIRNDDWETARLAQNTCTSPYGGPGWVDAFSPRVHTELRGPEAQPHELVASGTLTVPIVQLWNHGDKTMCGSTPMACTTSGGSVVMGATDCKNEALRAVITAQGPASRSLSMGVCVTDSAVPCNVHVSTRLELPNTDPAHPADYLTTIADWVGTRLSDSL